MRVWAIALLLLTELSYAQAPAPVRPEAGVVVPDGTPVRLRFAQAVQIVPPEGAPRIGQRIRLVAAEDVLVGGKLVISRGGRAQAIITRNTKPDRLTLALPGWTPFHSGVFLRLEWVESSNGVPIPLRALQRGKAEEFLVEVYSIGESTIARPWILRLLRLPPGPIKPHCELHHVPPGTLLTAYTNGKMTLDSVQPEANQPNEPALLTIYRANSDPWCGSAWHAAEEPAVSPDLRCGSANIGALGHNEYRTVGLPAGKYTCRADSMNPVEITLADGEESFLRLSKSKHAWQLDPVERPEGEDGAGACAAAHHAKR